MDDKRQKEIFSKNLKSYIEKYGKTQTEVANAIGEKKTTLNMWCTGSTMPSVSKIQKLADYFKIGKSDLTDEMYERDGASDASVLLDFELMDIAKKLKSLPEQEKNAIYQIISSLYNKDRG